MTDQRRNDRETFRGALPSWALILLALALLTLTTPASATPPNPCNPHGDETACFAAHQASHLAAFGLISAETHRDRGDQVRRVMIFGRIRNPVVAVEFTRVAGREPQVAIFGPRGAAETGAAPAAYAAAIPAAAWEEIGIAGRHFDRTLVPVPPPPQPRDSIIICTDAWLDVVETTDPASDDLRQRLRRHVEDRCENGLANQYSQMLTAIALRFLPACAGLPDHGNDALRLGDCAKLAGDRISAAEAFGRLDVLRDQPDEADLTHFFASDAALDWNGTSVAGGAAAARLWRTQTSGDANRANFYPERVRGESPDRIAVTGRFERWSNSGVDEVLLTAPVALTLVRGVDHAFHATGATVGPFTRAAHYCDANTLEIRCR